MRSFMWLCVSAVFMQFAAWASGVSEWCWDAARWADPKGMAETEASARAFLRSGGEV